MISVGRPSPAATANYVAGGQKPAPPDVLEH